MSVLKISSSLRVYEVCFANNFDFFAELGQMPNAAVVVDRNVYNLYKGILDKYFSEIILFDAMETEKTLAGASTIYDALIGMEAKRNLCLIAIGGGITQDVSGYVASTLYRGIKLILVPTTFLAQTDSCIGGKTAVNYKKHKNILGTFYPPYKVFINPEFIKTLSNIDFYSGIGETIKLQTLSPTPPSVETILKKVEQCKQGDGALLEVIKENIATKISYFESDEFDMGKRNLLNFGHCYGHAVEAVSDYYVPHGIAVTIGMIYANMVSCLRKELNEEVVANINEKLLLPNIPIKLKKEHFQPEALLACIQNDKKRIGHALSIVILDSNMKVKKIDDFSEQEFFKAHDLLFKLFW